ncbi:acetyl-CoA carboxylase biotin carboxylase subunit family protein [Methylomicrobium lacus]|uniref:ATP-grasp domain-containing protein n=1 Tax=Methylomicrobium lacus TaxID=136992 RepID=UPI0035A90DB8
MPAKPTTRGFTAKRANPNSGVFSLRLPIDSSYSTFNELMSNPSSGYQPLVETTWSMVQSQGWAAATDSALGFENTSPESNILLSFADSLQSAAAKAKGSFLPELDFNHQAIDLCWNKERLYAKLKAVGLMPIPYGIVDLSGMSSEDLLDDLSNDVCQYIVKPVIGSGSRVVRIETSKEELRVAIRRVITEPHTQRFMVMQYVSEKFDGYVEFSLDGVFLNGQVAHCSVLGKEKIDEVPEFRDRAMVTLQDKEGVFRLLAKQALEAIGVVNVVFHLEARATKDGVVLIDAALRPGGGFIPDAVKLATGLDIRLAYAYICAGQIDDVSRLISSAKPLVNASAIGAFYWGRSAPVSTGDIKKTIDVIESEPYVAGFNLDSNLIFGAGPLTSEAALSLCVGANSEDLALGTMVSLANQLGFV